MFSCFAVPGESFSTAAIAVRVKLTWQLHTFRPTSRRYQSPPPYRLLLFVEQSPRPSRSMSAMGCNDRLIYRLSNQLSDSESGSCYVFCSLSIVMYENIDGSTYVSGKNGICCAYGSSLIIGCPCSDFSSQKVSPRGIKSSIRRIRTARSAGLTMLAFT